MLKYILVLALAVASALGASAQAASDTHLVGHVVDKETGEHLPFYIIKLSGASKAGTMSDASGHYTFRHLTPGKYTVEASYTGYKTQTRHIDLKAGTTTELNFDVEPDAMMLDQVVVTGSKSELKRRHSPALVSVVDDRIFKLVNACSPTASTTSPECAWRTTARTAVSPRCA